MLLADFVKERNGDRATDTITKAVLGGIFTSVTFFVFFMGCWFISLVATSTLSRASWLALGITAFYFAVTFSLAWRRVDPLREIVPPSAREAARRDAIETIFPGGADKFENV